MTGPFGWCSGALEALEEAGLRRHPHTLGPGGTLTGRPVIELCSNDYLGLARHPEVQAAAAAAARQWGAGSGASRLVSGSLELHGALERALAAHKGTEDALVFSSGYLANVGTIPALAGRGDAIFSDALNHASVIDGCRLSGAHVEIYRHADPADLEGRLASTPARRRLVVTDSVFSMEGDLAPLGAIAAACRRHGAMLLVDDAHATGLLGDTGAGAVAAAGLTGPTVAVMATLSKALGSSGGFVAGPHALVEYLRNRARSYAFDTAPAPAAVGAALAALAIVRREPQRRAAALRAAQRVAAALGDLGYRVLPPAAAIVAVLVGDSAEAVALSARLLEAGVLVPAIRPPSVPPGTARLRVTVSAAHTPQQLDQAVTAFAAGRGRSRLSPARLSPAGAPSAGAPSAGARRGGLDPRICAAGGVFVTGTGTGVGKTVVAAALAKTLATGGGVVGALKPVQTGAADAADDLCFVRLAAGLPEEHTRAPYRFEAPLAPSVAARLEGGHIDLEGIRCAFRELRRACDLVVVEGAGGLLVPLDEGGDEGGDGAGAGGATTMATVAGALGLAVVVVAPPGLGMLNHTALTIEAARARGLCVLGVVLCRFPESAWGLAEATNPAALEALAGTRILGVVPDLGGLDVDRRRIPAGFEPAAWLDGTLGGRFDRAAFLETVEPRELCVDPA